jgi:cell division septum initiation protein DivIVA
MTSMDEVQQLQAENKQLKREVQELREKLTVAEAQIKHFTTVHF